MDNKNKTKDHYEFHLYDDFFYNFSSPFTRKSYYTDMNNFIQWLQNYASHIKSFSQVKRIHIIQYRNYLSEFGSHDNEPAAPKTISRKLSSLSSYFDYLVEKGSISLNPVNAVKRPRNDAKNATKSLDVEQIRQLLFLASQNKTSGKLHHALLTTFFYTGLRKSEILNLKFKDYQDYNGHKILNYKGKGGKLGQKLLHPNCIESIEEYLSWMKQQQRAHQKNDYLFQPTKNPHQPKNLNKALNPKTINEMIHKYALSMGLDFKISPHSARASFITNLLAQGIDIYTVALEVNHSSVNTTQEYDKRRRKIEDSPNLKIKI